MPRWFGTSLAFATFAFFVLLSAVAAPAYAGQIPGQLAQDLSRAAFLPLTKLPNWNQTSPRTLTI